MYFELISYYKLDQSLLALVSFKNQPVTQLSGTKYITLNTNILMFYITNLKIFIK